MLRFAVALALTLALGACKKDAKPSSEDKNIIKVDEDDAAMNKAIADARAHVDVFAKALAAPAPGQSFTVKKKFETPNGGEHMWLADVKAVDGGFEGTLDNEPRDATYAKIGQRYTVKSAEVSDWMITEEDGHIGGGYTVRAILPTLTAEERAQFEAMLRPLP